MRMHHEVCKSSRPGVLCESQTSCASTQSVGIYTSKKSWRVKWTDVDVIPRGLPGPAYRQDKYRWKRRCFEYSCSRCDWFMLRISVQRPSTKLRLGVHKHRYQMTHSLGWQRSPEQSGRRAVGRVTCFCFLFFFPPQTDSFGCNPLLQGQLSYLHRLMSSTHI